MTAHRYATSLHWTGSTADGIRSYSRDHVGTTDPPTTAVPLSADPAFRGNPERLNPEQLVVMAASSCQMLSFLGAAARASVEVLVYHDDATSHLDLTARPVRLGEVRLHPTVTVGADVSPARVLQLAVQAHRECYVAGSLSVPVVVETTVVTP
ncbi:OsmC family protein [Isoptericola halotolerans]|uniref:OsmC family protein n=1 Tax=Isoptericola halotolerans TaxID=300560 RepID=UPI00388DF201